MKKIFSLILGAFLVVIASGQEVVPTVFANWKDRVDPSVDRGLNYLVRSQLNDGSYPGSYGNSCGIPALAGMAFLSRGHLPTEGPYADSLNKIIDFLIGRQNREGLYTGGQYGSGPMYGHNIATLFLSEVSGMVDPDRQKKINGSLPRALSLILRAQAVQKSSRHKGGWRYHPNSRDSDTSCSGWALMALRSAKLNGADVPDKAIADAVAYLYGNFSEKNGHFGYSSPHNSKNSLTGMGLLCLSFVENTASRQRLKRPITFSRVFERWKGLSLNFMATTTTLRPCFSSGGSIGKLMLTGCMRHIWKSKKTMVHGIAERRVRFTELR